jgi:predicted phosphodiesterase
MKKKKRHVQKMYVVLPDPHRPFHNKFIWDKVLRFLCDNSKMITGLVWPGDYMDMTSLSRHHADSLGLLKDWDLSLEYQDGRKGLYEVDKILPKSTEKHFIFGNHEDFYFRELQRGDRAKYGLELKSPTEGLNLKELGYKVYENWKDDYVQLGKYLQVFHGIYTNEHAAKKHLDVFGSCIFGHTHRFGCFHSGNNVGWNIGTLCDINHPAFNYMFRGQKQKWVNGFAVVYIDETGYFWIDAIPIYNNTFFFNGKRY